MSDNDDDYVIDLQDYQKDGNDSETTTHLGNTIGQDSSSFVKKSRNFIMTIQESSFKYLGEIYKYLESFKSFQYILACRHNGPSHPHVHIYAQYSSAHKLSSKKLHNAHIEVCYGSAQANVEYCKGLDEKHKKLNIMCEVLYESGEILKRGGIRIKDVREMTDDELMSLNIHYKNLVRDEIERRQNNLNIDDWYKQDLKVIYIHGPSGIGKSIKARDIIRENGKMFNLVKFDGNFWHGVGDAKIALYDDFRPSDMKASEFINFIDYNVHPMNIKGGSRLNHYKLIIITSIMNPYNIYNNISDEAKEQWLRRIEIVRLGEVDEETYE